MTAEKNNTGETTVVMTVQKGGRRVKDVFDGAEPFTLLELCDRYRIERQELEWKLKPFRTIIGPKVDGYYSREQVQKIYLLIGPPEDENKRVVPLIAFPHDRASWRAACVRTFAVIQDIAKKTLPAYFCERYVEHESFLASVHTMEEFEVEERIVTRLEKELIIYRHFAFYQSELIDPSADILDRALTYYDLLLYARERQPLEIDAHLRTLSKALLCYAHTGSRKLYCDIDKLLFMHNEKQLQTLMHQLSIEVYCKHTG